MAAAVPMQEGHSFGHSGFLKTLFNSVNILCGVGLLATPYASAQMGWSSLLLLTVLGMHSCRPVFIAIKSRAIGKLLFKCSGRRVVHGSANLLLHVKQNALSQSDLITTR